MWRCKLPVNGAISKIIWIRTSIQVIILDIARWQGYSKLVPSHVSGSLGGDGDVSASPSSSSSLASTSDREGAVEAAASMTERSVVKLAL
ncbi:hypothetical protein DY000_02050217 [Brassica cretica]|uniref:Uncharacterized protein n=1 Tax=Brassica cretica TaxID=69181 RepID=A0ABQ7F7X0_BRACR|nr:hypothetical protein DY000_02050217 [Brassica cretica]